MNNEGLSQGARANLNGKTGEDILVPIFENAGYKVVLWGEYKKPSKKAQYDELDKLVIKQYPYHSIYNHDGKTEFLLINKAKERRIRIEVKWQQAAGSVDEKFPYLWLNCVYSFEEHEIILIVDGGGYKQGARDWLVEQAKKRWLLDGQAEKSVTVMDISEFLQFFNANLR